MPYVPISRAIRTVSSLSNPMSGRRTTQPAAASIARRFWRVWLETWPRLSPVTRYAHPSRRAIASATRTIRRFERTKYSRRSHALAISAKAGPTVTTKSFERPSRSASLRDFTAAASSVIGSREKCTASTSRPWRAIRWPATGLSIPPLKRRRAFAPTASRPHVLRVQGPGPIRVVRPADEGAPVGEDREGGVPRVEHDDGPDGPHGTEPPEAGLDAREVDRLLAGGVDRDRLAPAHRRDDLAALRPEELPLALRARGAVRAAGDSELLELVRPPVEHEELAGWGPPDEELNRLRGLEGSDDGGDRVQDARGVAGREGAGRGHLREEAPEAGRDLRDNRHRHAVRGDRAAVDPREASPDRDLVQEEPELHVVRSVHDEVDPFQNGLDVRGVDVLRDPLDGHGRVHDPQPPRGDLRLREVHVGLVEQHLPLEVVQLDDVAVDEPQVTDTRAGEEARAHRAEGPEADHRDGRGGDLGLAPRPDLGEVDLVARRVPAVGELHGEVPLLELPPEGLRVPHDLLRVVLPERLRLQEGLGGRRDPVPVRVVRDAPRERLADPREEILAVRHQEPSLRAEEGLVGAPEEDVRALPQRVLELPARDEPEDVAAVVGEDRPRL